MTDQEPQPVRYGRVESQPSSMAHIYHVQDEVVTRFDIEGFALGSPDPDKASVEEYIDQFAPAGGGELWSLATSNASFIGACVRHFFDLTEDIPYELFVTVKAMYIRAFLTGCWMAEGRSYTVPPQKSPDQILKEFQERTGVDPFAIIEDVKRRHGV